MKTNANYCPEINGRWNNYSTYQLILWAWMMNEIAVAIAPVDMSHNGFYIHLILYTIVAIFVGIPLVYSEICVAQYTNCDVISMWNYCPILRGVGYSTLYLIILKILYLMVLSSWYLEYAFVAALDPPPWFSCDGYDDVKCMVKRINITVFQHCIEAQNLFNEDCGMKTASSCFFEKVIGNNNTKLTNCVQLWKSLLESFILCTILSVLLIKKDKFVKIFVRILVVYVSIALLILFCVALSTSGTWYAAKIGIHWTEYSITTWFDVLIQGFLACGMGSGVIGFLSQDLSFRSPATMTAVKVPLFSIFNTLMFALILFSGVKTVSYYHGEELNILEEGNSIYFSNFASVAEILSYFDDMPLWSLIWFSTIFFCLLVNTMILCVFLFELLTIHSKIVRNYSNISCIVMLSLLCLLSCPFHCSDLTVVLTDVTEIIQLTSSFFFSVGIYWIYGFQKHNIDIIFMIGVKASYFWKIAWVTNPIWVLILVYMRWTYLQVKENNNSYFISSLSINLDLLLVYMFITFYFVIIIVGMLVQIRMFYIHDSIKNILSPLSEWGPRDKILFRSRNMFVPEIMTREFLYRQVKIHGYSRRVNIKKKFNTNIMLEQRASLEKLEWSTLTSN